MDGKFKIPSFDLSTKLSRKQTTKSAENINTDEKHIDSSLTALDAKIECPINATTKNQKANIEIKSPLKCSYIEPKWSQKPTADDVYSLEVLKNGSIVEKTDNLQRKAFWLIGKLSDNDIQMAHPTISRYHAVLQYRPEVTITANEIETKKSDIEKGWYLYDLSSTHGSFVNKIKIPAKTYVRIRVGYMIKFGTSTRNFILQGPDFDQDAESELSITELKELKRQKKLVEVERVKFNKEQCEAEGINWGMNEDAEEETDLTVNPFATTNNEELFLDDPKKTLRGFFEREGLDLTYNLNEMSAGTFVCRIELPISDSNGRPIFAEICHKGKKKNCVFQAALEACRILDRNGLLRQANHEPRKRKIEKSDSEDDDFYDRTGEVERKREEKSVQNKSSALSYGELLCQQRELNLKTIAIEEKIKKIRFIERQSKKNDNTRNDDDLDEFMSKLSKEKDADRSEIRKLKVKLQYIKSDQLTLEKLLNIARPTDLPPLKLSEKSESKNEAKKTLIQPLFGKRCSLKLSSVKPIKKQKLTMEMQPSSSSKSIDQLQVEKNKTDKIHDNKNTSTDIQLDKLDKESKILNIEIAENVSSEDNSIDSKVVHKREKSLDENHPSSSELLALKKRRQRVRVRTDRGGRGNVDIDDTVETLHSDNYSGWLPPVNQSGDGSTNLNEKYGY